MDVRSVLFMSSVEHSGSSFTTRVYNIREKREADEVMLAGVESARKDHGARSFDFVARFVLDTKYQTRFRHSECLAPDSCDGPKPRETCLSRSLSLQPTRQSAHGLSTSLSLSLSLILHLPFLSRHSRAITAK